MRLSYFVLVERVSPGKIKRIYNADLDLSVEGEQLEGVSRGLNRFIANKIREQLDLLARQGRFVEDPKGLEQYKNIKQGPHDSLLAIYLGYQLKRGFFARLLPILAKCSFVIAEVCSTVVSIAALEVTGSNQTSSPAGKFFKVLGAVSFGVSGLIMYFYSRSGYTLSKLGIKMDNLLQKKKPENQVIDVHPAKSKPDCNTSTKIIASQFLLSGLLLANIVVSNVSGYKGLDSLGKIAQQNDSIIPEDLFNFAKWVLVTFGSISALSFVGSFFDQFSEDISQYFLAKTGAEDREEVEFKEEPQGQGRDYPQDEADGEAELDLEAQSRQPLLTHS